MMDSGVNLMGVTLPSVTVTRRNLIAAAVRHAGEVVATQRQRLSSPANTEAGRLRNLRLRLQELVAESTDQGKVSVLYWHGRWLSYSQAAAALGVVRAEERTAYGAER